MIYTLCPICGTYGGVVVNEGSEETWLTLECENGHQWIEL